MTIEFLKNYFKTTEHPKFYLVDVFSWRGDYFHVAFKPSVKGTKEESITLIERALTEQFRGYKGGKYGYDSSTPAHFELEESSYDDIALYEILLNSIEHPLCG